MRPVLAAWARGDAAGAARELDRHADEGSVLWQLERGRILRAAGRLRESNEAFARARDRQDELFTRSLSNEAAALAVSDRLRPYRAGEFELPLLHVYSALNYLELGDVEDAVVEARALSQLLAERAEGDSGAADGFGRFVAGLIFEAAREWNDAWVAYRAARKGLERAGPERAEAVAWLEAAEERTAILSGLEPGPPPTEAARVVVWVEEGLVPPKVDLRLRVPVLESERDWGEDRAAMWGERLAERAVAIRDGTWGWAPGEVVSYLEVALPVYPPPRPAAGGQVLVDVNGDPRAAAFLAEDLEQTARAELSAATPGIAGRAAARALLKWLATRGAGAEWGGLGRRIVGLLGLATEVADTRGWTTLPARIRLAIVEVPAGDLRVEVRRENPGEVCAGEFALPPGGWHFVSCRFF